MSEHASVVRVAELAAQLKAAQEANTRLIARIVELEHERDRLRGVIRIARERLYDAHGSGPENVARVIRAVGQILRRDIPDAQPR